MAQPAEYQLPENWGRKASDYEAMFVPFSSAAAHEAVELAAIEPGERCLDVAAGTGAVTIAAARRGAHVTAVDFSEGMLQVLRRKLADERIDGVEVLQMDGQALDFADASFDVAGSGFGIVWFPDPGKGLRELHRVLRPGGRAFVTSTGHPGSSELQQLIGRAVVAAGATGDPGPVPVSASLPAADALAESMQSAGFRDVRVESRRVPWPITSPEAFWQKWALDSPPSAGTWRDRPESVREAAGREFVRLVEASGKRAFPTEVLVALGRK